MTGKLVGYIAPAAMWASIQNPVLFLPESRQ